MRNGNPASDTVVHFAVHDVADSRCCIDSSIDVASICLVKSQEVISIVEDQSRIAMIMVLSISTGSDVSTFANRAADLIWVTRIWVRIRIRLWIAGANGSAISTWIEISSRWNENWTVVHSRLLRKKALQVRHSLLSLADHNFGVVALRSASRSEFVHDRSGCNSQLISAGHSGNRECEHQD